MRKNCGGMPAVALQKRLFIIALVVVTVAAPRGAPASAGPDPLSVVPRPRYERITPGSYRWPAHVRIGILGAGDRDVAERLRAYAAENGVAATVVPARAAADIVLRSSPGDDARLGDEGYVLTVGPRSIAMTANTPHGLFNALQTLEQLSARSSNRLRSRAGSIVDWPAYRWRGIHLDVARHFFPVPVVERYIDVAAHYKLNVFHWHLTDDQAWRLRSDRYPALAAGNGYSKADVDEIVAYAAHRYVTVVPEIDLPAHADAALHAYPHLGCGYGTLCPTHAGSAFARDVWDEALARFPSPYVHVGGDEVPYPASVAQPRFTRELDVYLRSRGRRLVGWDEILTPQLPRDATVMAWTGRKRTAQAARHGNDVVVASGALYFDGAQGDAAQEPRASKHMSTLEQVYDDGITPPGLTPPESAHVIGAQANVWTEHIATADHLFYMALPRELALAEIAWTPRERKSWPSFLARLPAQFRWLEAHRYPFRIPNAAFAVSGGPMAFEAVPGHVQSVNAWTDAGAATVALTVPLDDAVIRYTTNGAAPSAASPAYRRPFSVSIGRTPVRVRAAAFLHGRAGSITECTIAAISPAAMRAHRHASKSWSALVSP